MPKEKTEQETPREDSGLESRRLLLKGIISSAPVVLSVTSRPVLAARNCSESGQLSGNMSGDPTPCGGEGCPADNWARDLSRWHRSYQPNDTFDQVFGVDVFGNATLLEVLQLQADTDVECSGGSQPPPAVSEVRLLGREAVAALQNAATGVSYDLDVAGVVDTVQMAFQQPTPECASLAQTTESLNKLNNQGCPW